VHALRLWPGTGATKTELESQAQVLPSLFPAALVGNFVAVNRALLDELLSWDVPARRLLADAGPLAADLSPSIDGEAGIAPARWDRRPAGTYPGVLGTAVIAVLTIPSP